MRRDRNPHQLRPIDLSPGVNRYAEGSALLDWGHTRVVATVSIDNRLPPHLRGRKHKGGWLTAEYALLPRATHERSPRERLYSGGRSQEIQRFLGRTLRSVTDLSLFPNQTLTVDVDVLQADGGTRCAGVLAGYAALHHAAGRLVHAGDLSEWPLTHELAAVSVGLIDDATYVDLDYDEDLIAEADLNVAATASGAIVEVQGGVEGAPIDAETYVMLVATGVTAVAQILEAVRGKLA